MQGKVEVNTIITGFGGNMLPYSNSIEKIGNLSLGSRFYKRVVRRYELEIKSFGEKNLDLFEFEDVLKKLNKNYAIDASLRILRQLVLKQILKKDCEFDTPLEEVILKISNLAEFCLLRASQEVKNTLEMQYGYPSKEDGKPCSIVIMAMGKLGAKELNVSSDVDLVYVYENDGNTVIRDETKQRSISNQEYFLKWAIGMQKLIGEVTEHGFVFRLDLALRPYGSSSSSVISLQALKDYFEKTARSWERFAWLKARVLGDADNACAEFKKDLDKIIQPFVYRPYVDFNLMEALREIHKKIQIQAEKKTSLKDVKLGRGGIREIEFGVQLFQIMHGGSRPELRTRSTFKALIYLKKHKLLSEEQSNKWQQAYRFLRTVEHRIQYLDDQQTHVLPKELNDQIWIAQSMGFSKNEELSEALSEICNYVQSEFDQLLNIATNKKVKQESSSKNSEAQTEKLTYSMELRFVVEKLTQDILNNRSNNLHEAMLLEISNLLELLVFKWSKLLETNSNESLINIEARKLKTKWMIELFENCRVALDHNNVGLLEIKYWLDWIDTIFRRDNYLAMQIEHPKVQIDIMHLLGASAWCRRYLKYYPSVIEQLVGKVAVKERLKNSEFVAILNERKNTIFKNSGTLDEEQLMTLLRREHHSCMFKILLADLNKELTIEEISDELSELANNVLRVCIDWIWEGMNAGINNDIALNPPPLAVIGYGKLGSKELGYGSDLDLVLLYDESDLSSSEQMPKLARRLITWMTLKTADGNLYDIDNALRPNGGSGLLVSSFEAFEKYQKQLDQNSAWTWEHQALTRARFCIGSDSLKIRFEKVRQEVLSSSRDESHLAKDVFTMRKRLWSVQKIKKGMTNGKYSPGGMVDVEFVVQYLILSQSNKYSELTQNIGNIGLLKLAESKGLIPKGMGSKAANAYRHLRQLQHSASLQENAFEYPDDEIKDDLKAIQMLWLNFFEPYWAQI